MNWKDFREKIDLWVCESNLDDLENHYIICILEDTLYSKLIRKIRGMDKWMEWVSLSFTKAENYRWKIEKLNGAVATEYICPRCGQKVQEL
jgi:hypothetical protein